MNADWPCHMLSDFITIKHGYAFKGEYFVDQATPDCLVTPGNFLIGGGFKADKLKYYQGPVPDEYVLQPGDLIVTMTDLSKQADTLGYSALVPDLPDTRLLHNQRIGLVKLNSDKLHPDYLYFLLRSSEYRHHVVSSATGSTVKHTSPTKIASFEFQLPSLSVQKAVAETLLALEKKTQLNHQINQTLEQMAQAIFKSWFVDFEPVKAKIAARERWYALQPGNESASPACYAGELASQPINIDLDTYMNHAAMQAISGKDAEQLALMQVEKPEEYAELYATAELFPSAMQDSELGEMPEGWEVGTVSDLLDFNPRRTLKNGTLAPYLDMKNVPTSGHLAVEVIEREMASGTKFINGDTLLARITPCLENGKTAYVDFLNEGQTGWGSTEYIVLRPKHRYPSSLGYFLARNECFRTAAIQSMTGTSGRQRANAKAMADLMWLIYPPKIVECFDSIAGSYLRLAKSHSDQSKSLSKLRDTLLPKLLSGELSVADIESEVEA